MNIWRFASGNGVKLNTYDFVRIFNIFFHRMKISSTSSTAIETYMEINLSLSDHDGRGYFTINDATPRVNEFGLVAGWYNSEENDYEAMMLITKFTRPSISLAEGDSVEAVYRLYAR